MHILLYKVIQWNLYDVDILGLAAGVLIIKVSWFTYTVSSNTFMWLFVIFVTQVYLMLMLSNNIILTVMTEYKYSF